MTLTKEQIEACRHMGLRGDLSDTLTDSLCDMALESVNRCMPVRGAQRYEGMTLWDYYAAAALTGVIAADTTTQATADLCARWAAETADAMIIERRKRMEESR